MFKTIVASCLLPFALAAATQAHAAKALSVDFTISHTNGFNGVDSASLNLAHGKLSGVISVISPGATYPCTLNPGSTDIHNKLNLSCTIGPEEIITLSGRLNPRTGAGKGSFSESFFKEKGRYTAAKDK